MGGRKQQSAIDAVMAMVHVIQMAKSNNHVVPCVLLDGKGAFDHVSIHQLIHIMTRMHLPPQIISWVKCFMSQRSISLAFDGKKQQMRQIDTGIPTNTVPDIHQIPVPQNQDGHTRIWSSLPKLC